MLTYYLERRDRRRDQGESRAEADRRYQESRTEEERRHRESRAEEERRHRESRAEEERRHQESRAEEERRHRESLAESERRHQETIAIISGLIAALAGDRQPAPDHSQAIVNLQQAVTELTGQVAQLNERIQNGNGSSRPDTQRHD